MLLVVLTLTTGAYVSDLYMLLVVLTLTTGVSVIVWGEGVNIKCSPELIAYRGKQVAIIRDDDVQRNPDRYQLEKRRQIPAREALLHVKVCFRYTLSSQLCTYHRRGTGAICRWHFYLRQQSWKRFCFNPSNSNTISYGRIWTKLTRMIYCYTGTVSLILVMIQHSSLYSTRVSIALESLQHSSVYSTRVSTVLESL